MDETRHLDRLARSLGELESTGRAAPAPSHILREVVRRNRVHDGLVYLQVTRGVARRDHHFPLSPCPALVVTARSLDRRRWSAGAAEGIAVVSVPDNRWGRVDIKSVGLLPNVLAKQHATEGAREAWFVDAGGHVTEGGSTNAWIVTRDGRLVTRQTDEHILAGRDAARGAGPVRTRNLTLEERAFTLAEALTPPRPSSAPPATL